MIAQISVFLTPAGTIAIEAPGANGTREKITIDGDASSGPWSEDDFLAHGASAILAALREASAKKRAQDIADAARAAQQDRARHLGIVAYASEKNPTTLKFIEPGAKPAETLRKFLLRQGYTSEEISAMSARGELSSGLPRRRSTSFFTQRPITDEEIVL